MATRKTKNPSKSQGINLPNLTGSGGTPNNAWANVKTVAVPMPSAQTVSYSPSFVATTGYIQSVSEKKKITEDNYYSMEISRMIANNLSMSSPSPPSSLTFYTEEEFVFSFMTIYNDISSGKKVTLTSNGLISIENVIGIKLTETINGVKMLVSPFYILKRAKELNYEQI